MVITTENEDTEKEWFNIQSLIKAAAKGCLGTSQKCCRKRRLNKWYDERNLKKISIHRSLFLLK
jgi:hypothetical protein